MSQINENRTSTPYSLTGMQEHIVLSSLNNENEPWSYHTQFSYYLKIKDLSLPLFFKAIKTIQDRHPIIKTLFKVNDNKTVSQFINEDLLLQIDYADISHLDNDKQKATITEYCLNDRNNKFDFIQNPNMRTFIHNRGKNLIHLTMSFNHAIWDGWSHMVFLKEIFEFYQRLKITPNLTLPIARYDYKDYLILEKKASCNEKAKHFWKQQVQNCLDFSPSKKTSLTNYDSYKHIKIIVPKSLVNKLKLNQIKQKATLKSMYLTAFFKVILEETQGRFATIGAVTNGRSFDLKNPLGTLGLLWNIAPITIQHQDDDLQMLQSTNKTLSKASAYGSYPLSKILQEEKKEKLFHAVFNFVNFEGANVLQNSDIELLHLGGFDKFNYPLQLLVGTHPFNGEVSIVMNYDTRYYNEIEVIAKLNRILDLLNSSFSINDNKA